MVKELIHDPIFLAQKSEPADPGDRGTGRDLLDTLTYHRETCVGMAANMIGVCKRIICFDCDGALLILYNPEILKSWDSYDTEESCLSYLGGPRKCRRWRRIKVRYETADGKVRFRTFAGFTAQIIQHEIDHCNGVLI